MILVDTSVWVGHLRAHDAALARLLEVTAVCAHPYIIGEIALGQLRQRKLVLRALESLPRALVATDHEVSRFTERHALYGRGIGYVDVCLLTAASLTANARLWTNDRKLAAVAADLGLAASPPFPPQSLG
ncbi:MAG: type II toxin-antitoxin system VapC family toxin [Pseudomonadota bacterium]|nr:type II toxin-antitoxin system VapC family toxin [Pseudomonadota bacterium]